MAGQKNKATARKSNKGLGFGGGIFSIRRLALILLAVAIGVVLQYRRPDSIPETQDPFEVADLPGRGKGLIATRDIKQGELILRERPLFTVPSQVTTSPSALVLHLVNQLTVDQRAAFYELSYVRLPKDVGIAVYDEQLALAIFQTNAVAAGQGIGIFPRMARLNHGCSSAFNSVYSWREKEGMIVVHALKDIKQGQELLTTYTNTRRSRQERRAYLSENYDFNCTCAVCSLPVEQLHASDRRLEEMSRLYGRFATWGQGAISGVEAVEVARRIWALGDEEGYWSERGRLAADAAWVAAAHQDSTAVKDWARLAVMWYSLELGETNDLLPEMELAISEPRKHGAWGSRERETVGSPWI